MIVSEERQALPATRTRTRVPPLEPPLTASEERTLLNAIKQLHVNTGHPSNASLARSIRVTGGSQRAVEMALNFRCEVCESQRRPGPHLPSRIRIDRDFNDSIGVDLFTLHDYQGRPLTFLNMVDMASGFTIACIVDSKFPAHVYTKLLDK